MERFLGYGRERFSVPFSLTKKEKKKRKKEAKEKIDFQKKRTKKPNLRRRENSKELIKNTNSRALIRKP